MARWTSLPFDRLPSLADAWQVVDFFDAIPKRLQGRLLLEMNRNKACLAELPEQGPLLLLRLRSAAMWLERGPGEQRIRAILGQPVRQDNAWILALMPGTGDFPVGALEFGGGSLRIGTDGLTLKPMPAKPFRPWSWRWSPTCGCGLLHIHLDRTADQIKDWLHTNPHLELDEARQVAVGDGAMFFRTANYRGLSREQARCDHAILLPLSQGALGELSFDLIDTDYGSLCATGQSCAELAAYLDPAHFLDVNRDKLSVRLRPVEPRCNGFE